MGMFDFLFGKPQTTTTQKVVGELSPELAPYAKEILKEAQDIFAKRKEEGYQPYEGQTVAEFDPDELAAFEKLKGLVGVQTPYLEDYEAALGEYGGSLDEFRKSIEGIETDMTAEGLKEYMSPYQQAVVDVQKRKAQEDFAQRIMPEFEKQAISAGGMSGLGSRAGVQAALLGTGQAQTLADIQAVGSQKAYEDAVKQFRYSQDAARQKAGDILGAEQARLGAAEDRRGLGLQKFNVGLAEAGLLSDIGQQRRQRAQTLLDEAYARELEKREFLPTELAKYQGFVYGSPFTQAIGKTQTTSTPRVPIGQQLLSAGLTGLNIYGQATGNNPFSAAYGGIKSFLTRKEGGGLNKGLSGLPVVKRQTPGSVRSGLTFGSPILRTKKQEEDRLKKIMGIQKETGEKQVASLTNLLAKQKQRQQKSAALRQALLDKYAKERKPTMTTGEMLAKPLAAASKAALETKNVGLIGALGAAGGAAMDVYADVRSDLNKEQRKYMDLKLKEDQLEIETANAEATKNEEREQEIEKEKIKNNQQIKTLEANLDKNATDEVNKNIDKITDIAQKQSKIELNLAEAATKGNTIDKAKAFNSAYKDAINIALTKHGYVLDEKGGLAVAAGGKQLKKGSPAYNAMLRDYEKAATTFLNLYGKNPSYTGQAKALLGSLQAVLGNATSQQKSKQTSSIASLKQNPNFNALIGKAKEIGKGDDQNKLIKKIAKTYGLKEIQVINLVK